MAKLSRFRQNSAAINNGEWVPLGEEYDNLAIRTRGFVDAYWDMQAAKQRREAQKYSGDINRLPSAVRRAINVECLIATVLIDVQNLFDDDGKPVTFDGFCEFLRDPDYHELIVACFRAAGQVGQQRQAEVDDVAGPLPAPSVTNSNGDNIPTS